jgi:trimethylamine--corrinoid protein Co-methyltransferase
MSDYGFFTPEQDLKQIHQTALRILSELGIHTDHEEMRERLAGLGCRVVDTRVYMPPELVAATLRAVPAGFTVYGRSEATSITVQVGGPTHCINTGIFANIYDLESGAVRRSTLRDVEMTTRVLDALDNVDAVYVSLVDATELSPHMITVSDLAATVANTTKPLIGPGVTNQAEAEAVVAIARAIRGGEAELRQRPLCVPFICPITPLIFPADVVDALMVVAQAGLPLDVVTNPVMGVTAPYTIASTVALGHAEVLASAVMAHAITPGLPILNQNTPSIADMRSLTSTTGGPETGLLRRAVIELSLYLGLPGCAHGHTSSTRLDWQAADEKALNTLLIASARPALLGGLGALSNVTLGAYEALLLDNERLSAVRRILDGIQVDENHLGFDVIARLTDGESVLSQEHTLRYLRSPEVWSPTLALRQGLVDGDAAQETSVERARSQVQKLIAQHEVEPLPVSVWAEIESILDAYDQACRSLAR